MPTHGTHPHISIVIPAYNEADWLPACLESLAAQAYSVTCEIIVVDNASTDKTADVARRFGARVIKEDRRGVCFARQAGLAAAHGDIVISTDADCSYPPGWLQAIADKFKSQPDVVLLLGNYRFTESRFLNYMLYWWESMALRIKFGVHRHWYVSAANLAFRRNTFDGYQTALTQGGDELFVVSELQRRGRVLYNFTSPISTSNRRLQKGFVAVFFHDFIGLYLGQYIRMHRYISAESPLELTGDKVQKPQARSYQAHRQTSVKKIDTSFMIVCVIIVIGIGFAGYGVQQLVAGTTQPLAVWFGLFSLGLAVLAYGICAPHAQLLGGQVYHVPTSRKIIALTFDDGPNGSYTTAIADVVASYGGHATFFQVGKNVQRWPEITAQLHADGHLIGNHSWRHSVLDYARPSRFRHGLQRTSEVIKSMTGVQPMLVRFPWLLRFPWSMLTARQSGLTPIGGTFPVFNEFRQPDAERMAQAAYRKSRPGALLIFHDGYNAQGADRTQTVEAVRLLCARLHAEGYSFVTLDELV